MRRFSDVVSVVAPLGRENVDTDQMVPKQFLKLVQRSGFGRFLFYNWRFLGGDEANGPDPSFVLNDPRYASSRILAAGPNFGCGSSREHAVWALQDYGFDVVVAPSFADIFYGNCFKNGVLPVRLPAGPAAEVAAAAGPVRVSLLERSVTLPGGRAIPFEIDDHRRGVLLEGLDEIDLTMRHEADIAAYERASGPPPVGG